MTPRPEPRQEVTPPPGWPTIDQVEGPYLPQAYARPRSYTPAPPGPAPDAFMQGPDGQPVALYAHPPQQPAPAPAPVPETFQRDPWPLRIGAAGLAAPGVGWGAKMLFGAMAGATTAIGYLAACLALAWLLRSTGGGGGGKVNVTVHANTTISQKGRWK